MASADDSETRTRLQSYLELLRLPNIFTAVADVAMGFFFVKPAWAFGDDASPLSILPMGAWVLGLLIAASCLLYSAGMVLNDLFDAELDRDEQPYRPIPAGRISLAAARTLGWTMLLLGAILSVGVASVLHCGLAARTPSPAIDWLPAIVGVGLAALIVAYNAGLKRTPLGPLAMGGCRTLNVLLGMSALREAVGVQHYVVAGGIGVYIAGVTWFARSDAGRSDRRQLVAAAAVVLVGVAMVGGLPWLSSDLWLLAHQELGRWYLIVGLLGGFVIIRTAPAILQPSPGPVREAVRRSITALVFLDAAACYASGGPYFALPIALLVIPTTLMRRWIDGG